MGKLRYHNVLEGYLGGKVVAGKEPGPKANPTSIGESYADFYRLWHRWIEYRCRRWGYRDETLEDMTAMMIEEFIAGGYLAVYNPELSSPSTFLWHFVDKRLKREHAKRIRSPQLVSLALVTDEVSAPETEPTPSVDGPDPLAALGQLVDEQDLSTVVNRARVEISVTTTLGYFRLAYRRKVAPRYSPRDRALADATRRGVQVALEGLGLTEKLAQDSP